MSKPPTIFLSVAEASGDLHAAKLAAALRRRLGEVRLIGAAGPLMRAEGCQSLIDLTASASMMLGPLTRPLYYLRALRKLQESIRRLRPDVVVPVDSPALNWHVAAAAREAGAPVMYYIAPQVWCWAPWRVRKLARLTDAVACILPFEQRYLRDRGVRATYVGHPLFDDIPPAPSPWRTCTRRTWTATGGSPWSPAAGDRNWRPTRPRWTSWRRGSSGAGGGPSAHSRPARPNMPT